MQEQHIAGCDGSEHQMMCAVEKKIEFSDSLGGILAFLLSIGNLGVDIFLFLSPVGLSFSVEKNLTQQFYCHRFVRVVLPYLIASVMFFFWYDFVKLDDGFVQYFLNVSTIQYWLTGNHPVWYVAFIIIMYALFPVLYLIDKKTRHLGIGATLIISVFSELMMMKAGCELYTNCERALSRIPVFLLGVMSSHLFKQDKRIPKSAICAAFLLGCGLTLSIPKLLTISIILCRFAYGAIGICIIICYSWVMEKFKMHLIPAALSWLGGISLEIYVIHVFALRLITIEGLWECLPSWAWYCGVLALGIVGGKVLQMASQRISPLKRFSQ